MVTVSFDEALAAVRERLGERGAEHCARVAETAAQLAALYDVDVDTARLAGVLHDWDRDLPRGELVAQARREGLEVSAVDEAVPYLLHARTGAAGIARVFPGIDPAVVQAVALHTVGSREMTPLDEVVYLADMMEPARDFHGVEQLRVSSGTVPLSELFAHGYQLSVMHLIRKRRRIHPQTIDVWNALVAGEPR